MQLRNIMLKSFIFIGFVLFISYYDVYSSIIINELQPAPLGDEPEWIELYNPELDTLILNDYTITDNASTKNLPNMIIAPLSYALLTKDTMLLQQVRNIPLGTTMYQATLPGLNNTFDMAVISDPDGITVDSMYYDVDWGEKGISFERIDFEKPANRGNIAPSKDITGATAGRENSVVPVEYDLGLYMLGQSKDTFHLQIKNYGKREAKQTNLKLLVEKKMASYSNTIEILKDLPNISAGDSLVYIVLLSEIENAIDDRGFLSISSIVNFEHDINPENDSLFWGAYSPFDENIVKINEFLYEPETNNAEFIEFINIGKDTIDIEGWIINDQFKQSGADEIIIEEPWFIPPSNLFVVAMDSSIFNHFPDLIDNPFIRISQVSFNLNNDSDDIILREPNGAVQDSLSYYSSWHSEWVQFSKNISLERISESDISTEQSNWVSCTDSKGSTPLAVNSSKLPKPKSIRVTADPNPFSRITSTQDGRTKITIEMPFEQGILKAFIFTADGILISKIADDIRIPSVIEIYWDGKNEDGYNLQIGPYVLVIEIADLASDQILTDKILVVIGE